jgi:type I restriction enzyme S subunit
MIPVPPLEEQQRIVTLLREHLSVLDNVQSTIDAGSKRAERLRQSILRKAFAGELVPQDPDDEPASALLDCIRKERALETSKRSRSKSRRKEGQYALW